MTYGNLRKAYGNLKEAYKNNKKDDDSELIHILSLMQDDNKNWTIHGLWVDYYKKEGYPEYCRWVDFDIEKLKPIIGKLNQYWFSDMTTNSKFWKHEYIKHGSCTNMGELEYFSKVLELYKHATENKLQDKYNKNGIALIPYGHEFLLKKVKTKKK
jgi:ribonuclease I